MGVTDESTMGSHDGLLRPASFRTDVEGMRAIAIGLVLLYHAGVPQAGGGYVGVDVFFVISGFLITGVMLRDIDRTGNLSLRRFWTRRARRLLPAAFFALAGASLITWLWLPITQRAVFGKDIVSAAFYVVNWVLAARSVDYLSQDIWLSPVQHFWSLAVEEQFYIIWPLVVVAALVVARKIQIPARIAIGFVIGAATVASLWWSIIETGREPTVAYFSTFTRFWEIGLGAVVAMSVANIARLPDRVLVVAGWVGLIGVGFSAVFLSESTPFPSYWALLPTVSTALMISSGLRRMSYSPYRLLSTRPAVWLGGISYSVYLWHWLALVAATAWWGALGIQQALFVVAVSFVPAILIHRLVENPIRFGNAMKTPRNALKVGSAFVLGSAVCGIAVVFSVGSFQAPGITPNPTQATADIPDADAEGCLVRAASVTPHTCVYGDEHPGKTVMLVGDSKAAQWEPAIQIIAEQSGWQLQVMTKVGCPFSEADVFWYGERYAECRTWDDAAMQVIADQQPDLVIVSGVARKGIDQSEPDSAGESSAEMAAGYAERWDQLVGMGITVAVILDNPTPPGNMYECAAVHIDELSECTFDLIPALAQSGAPTQAAAADLPNVDVHVIDLTNLICPNECSVVTGNVLVYRQRAHVTRTFAELSAPHLASQLFTISNGALGQQ
jgi:peptidoglycan/LPS O-acetylase OafA/YrhL